MQERPSEGQLEAVCTSVKAKFTKLAGFGYSCFNRNCNGEGDYCSITCHDDRSCTAQTPNAIKGALSLRGILQNGDNVDRSGSAIESGGSSSGTEDLGTGAGGDKPGNTCGPDGCLY
jgi:hypothetical protein